ncbi:MULTISPECIES: type II toxin-antitoxin system Phd/YefM family antitoxin [unclassified Streptomyces]
MKTITQREFRNNSAEVMNAVEAGEVFHITRKRNRGRRTAR